MSGSLTGLAASDNNGALVRTRGRREGRDVIPAVHLDYADGSLMDPSGRFKVAQGQNVYDVDFEYGLQQLRWDNLVNGTTPASVLAQGIASITNGTAQVSHIPQEGAVRLRVNTLNDTVIRQSKPYFRYQPSKGLYCSAAVVFGAPVAGIVRRIGMFDNDNGVFFEQDSTGISVVRRSNAGGTVTDTRVAQTSWNIDRLDGTGAQGAATPSNFNPSGVTIDWSRIQMVCIDYAWYGAGRARFGVIVGGKLFWCHAFDAANVSGQVRAWARTGNFPCRYEMRRVSGAGQADFIHYGVSVVVEGMFNEQRGFTYPAANGASRIAVTARRPILSARINTFPILGETNTATAGAANSLTRTGAGWTVNQWAGAYIAITGGTGAGQMARVVSNTATVLTCDNPFVQGSAAFPVAPDATSVYAIYPILGRGQLIPRQLNVVADNLAYVELVLNPTSLTGANWQNLSALSSPNSLTQRDIAANALTGGEVIAAGYVGSTNPLQVDLREIQPLGTNIRGDISDILTVVATPVGAGTSNVAAVFQYQEAMS